MTLSIENEYKEIPYADSFLSDEEIYRIADRVVEGVLSFESFPYDAEVSLLITTDEEIRMLNKEFRNIDASTDVLSFPAAEFYGPDSYEELSVIDELFDPDTGDFMLGDIVISAEHCLKQAELYGHSAEREFAFLIAHSVLHLIGYDHTDETDTAIMEARQEEILSRLGYTR